MSSVVPIDSAKTPAHYALRYAAIGWYVLPVWWLETDAEGKIRCACGDAGCKSPGKHPIIVAWQQQSSCDEKTVAAWFQRWPKAHVAIHLAPSGLCAIDIDPRNGGLDTIERLETQHGQKVAAAVQALTGGGGSHQVYATRAANVRGSLGPGIDVKHHGYIVVEPSGHVSGHAYAWEAGSDPLEGAAPEPLPAWLHDLLVNDAPQAAGTEVAVREIVVPETVAQIQQALTNIPADSRDVWLQVGMALHESIGGTVGYDIWQAWSQGSPKFDARDQLRVWRSFKVRGQGGVTYRTIFHLEKQIRQGESPAVVALANTRLVLTLAELNIRAAAIRWAVKGAIPEASIGMFFGASGAFKSFVALDYALHRAWGLRWLGRKTKQAPQVYLAAEGGAGIMRRVLAWHQQRNLDWRQCPMFVVAVPMVLRTQSRRLAASIRETGIHPGDIIVDTLSQTYDGDENSATEMADWLRVIGTELRDVFNATVLVIHHTGHSNTERPRGSSAITANADFLYGCFRDEQQMLATLECVKQKDGDKIEPATFTLTKQVLGKDEDGDEISSLSAAHADSAQAVLESARKTRSGSLMRLLEAVDTGRPEKEVRLAFYSSMPDSSPDARQKAFVRAMNTALSAGALLREGDWISVASQQTNKQEPDIK